MVSAATRLSLAAALALVIVVSLPAKELAAYRIGDTVEEEVVTPVALRVVDVPGTQALRDKELGRIPIIFKYDPGAADAAERDLREAFSLTRSNFLKGVQQTFPRRQRSNDLMQLPRYRQFISAFQKTNTGFPLITNLAELWLTGDTGRFIQGVTIARLRKAQDRPLRAGVLPPDARPGSRVRFVTVTNAAEALSADTVERQGKVMMRTNLIALARARTELVASFAPEDRAVAKFAASLLRANCFYEAEMTEQVRARHTAPIFAAENFEAGQVIARRGQTVDARVKAALDELRDKTAVSQLTQKVNEEQARAEQLQARADQIQTNVEQLQAGTEQIRATAERIRRRNRWLAAGLALATVCLGFAAWRLFLRKPKPSLLPVRVASDGLPASVVTCPSCDENIVIPADATAVEAAEWRRRALAAEQKAERAHAAIRSGVLPQFSRWLKQHFVRGLISDHSQMLEAQKAAATEMAELERRLDELHAPLQERLRAYEQRVSELEKTLAAKGAENRELIKAKIQLTRRQMETERARSGVILN